MRRDNGTLRIGALTRHYQIQQSDEVQQLPAAAGGNRRRSRRRAGAQHGHHRRGAGARRSGRRLRHAGADARRDDHHQQALDRRRASFSWGCSRRRSAPDELVTEVSFPVASGPHTYMKFRRRMFDWAIVGGRRAEDGGRAVARRRDQRGADAGARARRRAGARVAARRQPRRPSRPTQGLDPTSDLRGSAEYKNAPGAGADPESTRRSNVIVMRPPDRFTRRTCSDAGRRWA